MKNVDSKTRAGKNGREIYCPDCNTKIIVFHFSWTGMECQQCKGAIEKSEWLTEETPAELLGKKGGQAKSEAKTKAARENASKPRGKWATAIAYAATLEGDIGEPHDGVLLVPGKFNVERLDDVRDLIRKATGKTPQEIWKLDSVAKLI